MYLEISGRRTGKTTRLVKALAKGVLQYGDVNLLLPTPNFKRIIADKLEEIFGITLEEARAINVFTAQSLICDGNLIDFLEQSILPLYVEEFDLFKIELPINPIGYYSTTPTKLRAYKDTSLNDNLLALVEANGGKYEVYTSVTRSNKEYWKQDLSKDTYDTQVRGNIWK